MRWCNHEASQFVIQLHSVAPGFVIRILASSPVVANGVLPLVSFRSGPARGVDAQSRGPLAKPLNRNVTLRIPSRAKGTNANVAAQ